MTFQQLTYVVEISKCGSINKAAQKLFLSQSGISTAVRELENELGIRVLARSNRGVEFTPEGKEFLGYAVSLLEQKQRIESLYGESRSTIAPVHFSVSTQRYPFTEDAFLEMLQQNQENRYQYTLKETSMDGVIDDVYDHRADIGVIFLDINGLKDINDGDGYSGFDVELAQAVCARLGWTLGSLGFLIGMLVLAAALSRRFAMPIAQGLEAAKSCEHDWQPTGIREIDELTVYFHSRLRESRPEDALPRQVESLVSELIDRSKGLTSSERIILRYYAEGYTVKDIPGLLFISMGTVKGHNSHIYSKLGVDSYDALKAYLDVLRRCGRLEELLQSGKQRSYV